MIRITSPLELISLVGWYGSYKLLIYQYRKGLSEKWYSHKAYWVFNFIVLFTCLIYGSVTSSYTAYLYVQNIFSSIFNIALIVLMLLTKERTIEKPRPGILITNDGNIYEELENGQNRTTSFANFYPNGMGTMSMTDALAQQRKNEPKINVRIKPRAKDHPSDDFKVVVNYQVHVSKDEIDTLRKLVPNSAQVTPVSETVNNPNYQPLISESIIEEDNEEIELPKPRAHKKSKLKSSWIFDRESNFDLKTITVNLIKSASEVLILHDIVRAQYEKNA